MTDISKEQLLISQIWPALFSIHKKYPNDTLFIDLTRVHLLFDTEKGIITDRWDPKHELWSSDNPFPVNSTSHTNDIVSIWQEQNKSVIQPIDDILWFLKIREKYPERICLIVCQNAVEETIVDTTIMVPTFTMHVSQIIPEGEEGIAHQTDASDGMLLSTNPNSTRIWFCRWCAKANPKRRCPQCVNRVELIPDSGQEFSKPGTYYCDESCQKKDWLQHKKYCKI